MPYLKLEGNGPIDERATVVEVSVANFIFIFEISYLNYPGIYVHVASNSQLGGLWGYDALQMTSEVVSDLKIELSDLNYPCSHAYQVFDKSSGQSENPPLPLHLRLTFYHPLTSVARS